MALDIQLKLEKDELKNDIVFLVAENCNDKACENSELYERENDESNLIINLNHDTGELLNISLDEFTSNIEQAVKMLREYPLPWTFSLPDPNIKAKPLEDVLLAVYKKYKNIKMGWE